MDVQPHDWALPVDHSIPVLDEPQRRLRRPPRTGVLTSQHRTAAHQTWQTLDRIKTGGTRTESPVSPASATPRAGVRRMVVPRRFLGHAAMLALVSLIVVTGGFPSLAFSMDWRQGATLATDHVAEIAEQTSIGSDVPIVIQDTPDTAQAMTVSAADALAPMLARQQTSQASAFVGTHVVAPGEKLGEIAAAYNVPVLSIVAANSLSAKLLPIGLKLRIPRVSGLPHQVADGETVESIADHYNVPTSAIRFFSANSLGTGRALQVGEEIFIPGAVAIGNGPTEAEVSQVTAIPAGRVRDDETRVRTGPSTAFDVSTKLNSQTQVGLVGRHENWFKVQMPDGGDGWISSDLLIVTNELVAQVPTVQDVPQVPTPVAVQAAAEPAKAAAKPAAVANRWVWPTSGDITSGFGYRNMRVGRFHNGIDIANAKWTPIRAARGGTVIAAGWCSGYGYCVKINHGDGFVTEYGHLAAQPVVGRGQHVVAGQRIGSMGSTYDRSGGGYSTGVHLHFTVKRNGSAVNPLRYLP